MIRLRQRGRLEGPWFVALVLIVGNVSVLCSEASARQPISLHPENPHYLLFRGRPTVLVTSTEHYGAVLNADFDGIRYLDTLQACHFNLTKLFTGVYCEVPQSFGIENNALAPAPGRLLCPWARSSTPGNRQGGNKFDLNQWNPEYFARLREFVAQAGQRGIVVELALFCPFYVDEMWDRSPLKSQNNVNGIGNVPRTEVYTLKHSDLLAVQERMTRKILEELNEFDNLYYEVCNEPYFGGVTAQWQDRLIATMVDVESRLAKRHLIAQNVANGSQKVDGPNPAVSIFNFHYASPPDAVDVNYGLKKPIADDETGGNERSDFRYRAEGWEFLLAGGAVYDNLDFSFTAGHERGDATGKAPGGGGPALRSQLKILKTFMEGLDFLKMAPANSVIQGTLPSNVTARVLANPGHQYAAYVRGDGLSELTLDLPAGSYQAGWIDTKTGKCATSDLPEHAGGKRTLSVPHYSEDIALRLTRKRGSDK